MQFWGRTTEAQEQASYAQAVFYGTFLLLSGPLALLASWALSKWRGGRVRLLPLAFVSLLWIWFLSSHLRAWSNSPLQALLFWWGGLILAAPFGALVLHAWAVIWDLIHPRDLEEHLKEEQRSQERQSLRLSRRSARLLEKDMLVTPGALTLGVFMAGDDFPPYLGVQRRGPRLILDEAVLQQHLLVIGATGAGKSETLKRIVSEALRTTDRDVFFVDGKGDPALGREIAQMIHASRGQPVPFFSLGHENPGAVYHGFCGQAADIYNRLCALVGVADASGNATYYSELNRNLLQLICYAPAGPPRSFEEVRQRLTHDWLLAAYLDDPEEYATIEALTLETLESLRARVLPLAREFAPVVGEEGFRLETQTGAVFSLRTQSVGDSADAF